MRAARQRRQPCQRTSRSSAPSASRSAPPATMALGLTGDSASAVLMMIWRGQARGGNRAAAAGRGSGCPSPMLACPSKAHNLAQQCHPALRQARTRPAAAMQRPCCTQPTYTHTHLHERPQRVPPRHLLVVCHDDGDDALQLARGAQHLLGKAASPGGGRRSGRRDGRHRRRAGPASNSSRPQQVTLTRCGVARWWSSAIAQQHVLLPAQLCVVRRPGTLHACMHASAAAAAAAIAGPPPVAAPRTCVRTT